ncbi:MAG: crotonase/enoyl-CoA hydratase family protein [Actinomycetota bacterium]|nr:crotonase/enoyl-CoA hydratase family protein [Actinomycetota bacterium]
MAHECFDVEVSDKVAHVRMIRPEKSNSMIPAFWRELPEIVDGLSDSGSVRAIVLSAEGRNYCSGMDLAVFAGDDVAGGSGGDGSDRGHRSRRNERFRSFAMRYQDSLTSLERARMPVLCAIQGACVGGGVDLVSAADLRYATESAWFCIQEINIGMTADVGTLQRMPKLVAEGIVRELAYTGRRWSAAEARAAGFVNELYPDHETMVAAVLDVAAEIAAKSPMAIWGTKRTIDHARDHSVAEGLEFIANWNAAMFDTDDMAEAFAARAENRAPNHPDLPPSSVR